MLNKEERKLFAEQLSKLNSSVWESLSSNEKDEMVDAYEKLTGFSKQSTSEAVRRINSSAREKYLLLFGLVFGLLGSSASETVTLFFEKVGVPWPILASVAFIILLCLYWRTVNKYWVEDMQEIGLFSKLLREVKKK